MSGQTVRGTVAERKIAGAAAILGQYGKKFATMLPSHMGGDAWLRVAEAAISRNADLQRAAVEDPGSLVQALATAALWGLNPGTDEYYLTPRPVYQKQQKRKIMTTLGITGYQGYIELMFRAGAVNSVKADVVVGEEKFTFNRSEDIPNHQPDWMADRRHAPLKLAYAYASMKDGGYSQVIVLNQYDIDEIKKKSPSAASEYSPWQTNPASMWLKSPLRQLRKFVPTSAEYINTQARAAREEAGNTIYVPSVIDLPQSTVTDVIDEDTALDRAEADEVTPPERERIEVHQPTPTPAAAPTPAAQEPPAAAEKDPADDRPAGKSLLTKLDNAFTAVGWSITEDQLRAASVLAGRTPQITKLADLTNAEAYTVLNTVNACLQGKDPQTALIEAITTAREGEAGQ